MAFDLTNSAPASLIAPGEKWADVRVALTSFVTNPETITAGAEVDGVTLNDGDRFVCVGTRADAGIYVVGVGGSTRAPDADAASDFVLHRKVRVREGSAANIDNWIFLTEGAITLGVTELTFSHHRAESISLFQGDA